MQTHSCGEDAKLILNLRNGMQQEIENVKYVVHSYIQGWDLNQWLVAVGPIGETIGQYFVSQLFDIVSHLHKNSISHNNLFNKSIIICSDTFQIKLSNFELVQNLNQLSSELHQLSSLINSLDSSCSTEGIDNLRSLIPLIQDFRPSDIFNIGQIIFQAITGSLPFSCYFCPKMKQIKVDENCKFYQLLKNKKYIAYWNLVDPDNKLTLHFRDLIQCMLDQENTQTIEQLKCHKWLKQSPVISRNQYMQGMQNLIFDEEPESQQLSQSHGFMSY